MHKVIIVYDNTQDFGDVGTMIAVGESIVSILHKAMEKLDFPPSKATTKKGIYKHFNHWAGEDTVCFLAVIIDGEVDYSFNPPEYI